MIQICKADTSDRIELHANDDAQIYSRTQWRRLRKTRLCVRDAIQRLKKRPTILELGCAALDLSGVFAPVANIKGVDCNPKYLPIAEQRHPDCGLIIADVNTFLFKEVDILVLCEILEHLLNPEAFVQRVLPLTKYAIISHPINEKPRSWKSCAHYWSFNDEDFDNWFSKNSYDVVRQTRFMNGGFDTRLALGKRRDVS